MLVIHLRCTNAVVLSYEFKAEEFICIKSEPWQDYWDRMMYLSDTEQASSWRMTQMNWNGVPGCYKIPIIVIKTLRAWVHVNISSPLKPRLMWHPSHTSAEPDPLHHLHVSLCAASVPLINLGGSNDALSVLSGDSALWRTYIIYQTMEHGASIRPGLRCTKKKKNSRVEGK